MGGRAHLLGLPAPVPLHLPFLMGQHRGRPDSLLNPQPDKPALLLNSADCSVCDGDVPNPQTLWLPSSYLT